MDYEEPIFDVNPFTPHQGGEAVTPAQGIDLTGKNKRAGHSHN